jgi:hypothetical protein
VCEYSNVVFMGGTLNFDTGEWAVSELARARFSQVGGGGQTLVKAPVPLRVDLDGNAIATWVLNSVTGGGSNVAIRYNPSEVRAARYSAAGGTWEKSESLGGNYPFVTGSWVEPNGDFRFLWQHGYGVYYGGNAPGPVTVGGYDAEQRLWRSGTNVSASAAGVFDASVVSDRGHELLGWGVLTSAAGTYRAVEVAFLPHGSDDVPTAVRLDPDLGPPTSGPRLVLKDCRAVAVWAQGERLMGARYE